MVVHRTCSFCAGEIEPGTGQLFVKRDGSLFSFCSSSCRKQQMNMGRVGHRLRWTHAHELKRQAEQRRQPASREAPAPSEEKGEETKPKAKPSGPRGSAKARPAAKAAKAAAPDAPPSAKGAETAAKKPRPKKPAS